jgi:hypothetical protein
MNTATDKRVGTAGSFNGYSILVIGDTISVDRDGEEIARRTVVGLGKFVASVRDLRLAWGQFPDDAEVIFVYDKADASFGYALNLARDWSSEWGDTRLTATSAAGYALGGLHPETPAQITSVGQGT